METPRGLASYLGAARVVRLGPRSILVALEEATVTPNTLVHATLALGYPYRPAFGDQLLVVGDAASFYIIGVLAGRGRTSFSNPLGVALRAEGGSLGIVGDRGVSIRGDRIHLETQRLRRLATTVVQTFARRVTHVRGTLTVEAGDIDEQAQGGWLLQARRVVVKTLKNARIKSTTVRVG